MLFDGLMISDDGMAKRISDLMQDMFVRIDESVSAVKQTCSHEEADAYVKATARIVGPIVFEVMEPLYEKHPSLKPSNWDD
jgi:hypothetical protein